MERDYAVNSDWTPQFSLGYPPGLQGLVNETEWAEFIREVNARLDVAFEPTHWRNVLECCLSVWTLYIFDMLVPRRVVRQLRQLDAYVSRANGTLFQPRGCRVVPLARTAYLNVCCWRSIAPHAKRTD